MFICDKCLESKRQMLKEEGKKFPGFISFITSYGQCEICHDVEECNDWRKEN